MKVKFNMIAQDWSLRLSDEELGEILFALSTAAISAATEGNRNSALNLRDDIKLKMEGKKK